jgi:hypothetical protein
VVTAVASGITAETLLVDANPVGALETVIVQRTDVPVLVVP